MKIPTATVTEALNITCGAPHPVRTVTAWLDFYGLPYTLDFPDLFVGSAASPARLSPREAAERYVPGGLKAAQDGVLPESAEGVSLGHDHPHGADVIAERFRMAREEAARHTGHHVCVDGRNYRACCLLADASMHRTALAYLTRG